MQKKASEEVHKLASVPPVGVNASAPGFETVKGFLARFGYLNPGDVTSQENARSKAAGLSPVLDDQTSKALMRYQAMHGLLLTGTFDAATKEMMSRARCGFPDVQPASGVA